MAKYRKPNLTPKARVISVAGEWGRLIFARSRFDVILLPIILLAFALRVAPIYWGVPTRPYVREFHPDEIKILTSVLEFPKVYGTTKPFPGYGTSVQYLVGLVLWPVRQAMLGPSGQMTRSYFVVAEVCTRFVSVLGGVLAVLLTYRLSVRLYNRTAARISALLLSVAFLHVLNSPLATLDVMTSLFLVASVLGTFRALESGRAVDYVLLGLLFGLMLGMKVTMGMWVVVPGTLLAWRAFSGHGGDGQQPGGAVRHPGVVRNLVVCVATAAMIFAATNPQWLVDSGRYLEFFTEEKHNWIDRTQGTLLQMLSGWPVTTAQAVGIPCAFLGFMGVCVPGRTRLAEKIALVVFVAVYYVFWRWFLLPRYVITVAPLLCVFAGGFCARSIDRDGKAWKAVGLAVVALSVAWSLRDCVLGISDRLNDARPEVSRYITEHLPTGSTIGLAGTSEEYPWTHHRWRYPELSAARFQIVDFLQEPEYVVVADEDATRMARELDSGKLMAGYVLPDRYAREWYQYSPPSPRIFRFFDELRRADGGRYRLMASFPRTTLTALEFPSPGYRIYRRSE